MSKDVRGRGREPSHLFELRRSAARWSTQAFRFGDDVQDFFIHSNVIRKPFLYTAARVSCTIKTLAADAQRAHLHSAHQAMNEAEIGKK